MLLQPWFIINKSSIHHTAVCLCLKHIHRIQSSPQLPPTQKKIRGPYMCLLFSIYSLPNSYRQIYLVSHVSRGEPTISIPRKICQKTLLCLPWLRTKSVAKRALHRARELYPHRLPTKKKHLEGRPIVSSWSSYLAALKHPNTPTVWWWRLYSLRSLHKKEMMGMLHSLERLPMAVCMMPWVAVSGSLII